MEGTPRCVGEHLPTHFGVQFKLVRFYYTQRRAGRPRSSPLPLRGNCRLRRCLAFWFCRCVNHSHCRRAIMIYWRRNRPAVGYPPYDHQPVLAFRSNFFDAITHRGGRDARVPVRCRFAANLCGITRALTYAMIFCPFRALMQRIDTVYCC
ncbi:MAG: hypothetical protein LBQ66_16845 [Planctomycetaceae bacterium]|nr:hypothetical protein [Planctomycetaceae bacterium]